MYEEYTDKQIVKMLKPKLKKAIPDFSWDMILDDSDPCNEIINMVATIYRSGYTRGRFGKSFIIGEKKESIVTIDSFKRGKKVKFIGSNDYKDTFLKNRDFYPPVGTIGQILSAGKVACIIQWPKGATSGDDIWGCRNKYLKKVEEKWAPATKNNIAIDSTVRFAKLGEFWHNRWPELYPKVGTIGKVVNSYDDDTYAVQWPKDSLLGGNGLWSTNNCLSLPLEWLEVLVCE